LFHEVGGFKNRQLAQFLHEVSDVCHSIVFFRLVVRRGARQPKAAGAGQY
jgi:hypothetical protein